MSDVAITIKLPKELVERAEAAGVKIEEQSAQIAVAIEAEIKRREAGKRLFELMDKIDALPDELKPTPEEIDAEIKAVRAERIGDRKA
jgi:hypothetical protein